MGLLVAGTRESATLNIVLVLVKLVALSVFAAVALPAFHGGNLEPFMPHGFRSADILGEKRGVMAAAAIIVRQRVGMGQGVCVRVDLSVRSTITKTQSNSKEYA